MPMIEPSGAGKQSATPQKEFMALTVAQLEHAIKQKDGNLSEVARALGVARSTVYRKIHKHDSLQELLHDVRNELVDIAIGQLGKKVRNGDNSAIFYVMNNSPEAKQRGWGPRQEVAGVKEAPLTIVVQWPEDSE